jgi:hypothetical protein
MKIQIISYLKNELFILSMWKLTLGYGTHYGKGPGEPVPERNPSNLIGWEATPSCSNRLNQGLFQRKKMEKI